jgi:hypothetical protein
MLENMKESCNCKKKNCERYGKCKECIEYHENSKRKSLTYCKRVKGNTEEKLS